jgi:uncharacterized protein (TIGR03086 family)
MRINTRTAMSIVDLDAQAVRASVDLVARATAADLDRPTPCDGWTLRDLLAHMTVQHDGFAAAARGDGDLARWQARPGGDDPVVGYGAAAGRVLGAFAADGVLDREFPLPEIRPGLPFPARQAIGFHFVDYVTHSWDVARTLGLPVSFEPALLDRALAVAAAVPGGEARLAPGAAFGPEVAWSAPGQLSQLVALLGRSPDWQRPR